MKLILENFKCYSNTTEINFINNGLIYLNGKSGAGKSTIFKAICFVLFGKEQKISNYKNMKKKTTVQLISNNIHIIRTRLPNTLKCTQNNITYLDDSAQAIINKIFGHHTNFNLTSYIAQKNIENFLQLSKDQKTAFLQKLAIEEYPIEILKEKIKNELKLIKNDLLNYTSKLIALKNLNNKYFIQNEPIFNTNILSLFNLKFETLNEDILKELIIKYKQELDIFTEAFYKYETYISEVKIYDNLIQELENSISSLNIDKTIKNKNKNEIQQLIKDYNFFIKTKNELDKYNQKITEINNELKACQTKLNQITINSTHYSQETLYKFKFILEKYKCNSMNLLLNLYVKNRENFEIVCKKIVELEEQNKTNNKKIYSCPCCNENLFINKSNNLEKVDKQIFKENELIDTKEISKYKNQKLQLEIFFNDFDSIDKLKKNLTSDLFINDINKYIDDIKNKGILEEKISNLKLKLEDTLKHKKNINENELNFDTKFDTNIDTIIDEYNKLFQYKVDMEKYKINIKNLENCNKDTNLSKDKLNELKKINNQLNELSNNYKNFLFEKKQYSLFLEYKKEILELENKENILLKKKYNYEEFYTKVLQSESKSLEYIIDTINLILEEYISIFFEDEISVFLTNTITNTNGEKKYCIDVEIIDKNGNEISIDNLSGGEYDRCALALFLSFNRLSNSPILLLDECLSSLHSESIETIIESIKNTLSNKQVIVTLHQGNHGMFDEIVNIEEYNK